MKILNTALTAIGSCLLGSTLLLVATSSNAAAQEPPAVGAKAPDFTLNSQEGKPVSLKDFRGKWVVLYFYPKDMTQGCTIEAHNFQRDQELYTKRNAVVLGVSVDNADSHKQFCTKEGLTFKLLADSEKKVTTATRLRIYMPSIGVLEATMTIWP